MDPAAYLTSFRTDSAAFAAAVTGDRDAAVPCCPGWTLAELLHHLGGVHRFWTGALARTELSPPDEPELPPVAQVDVAWYEAGAAALSSALEAADPSRPMWNWSGVDQTAGWLHRRMALETAVHRWDAESATSPTGTGRPIADDLAVDGLDELFEVFVQGGINWYGDDAPQKLDLGGSLLVQPEGGRAWRVALGPSGCSVEPAAEGASADAIVSGGASDLLLLLWNRTSPSDATPVSGDAGILERWRSLPIFD